MDSLRYSVSPFFLFKWDNYADHHLEAPYIRKKKYWGRKTVRRMMRVERECGKGLELKGVIGWLVRISYKIRKTLGNFYCFFFIVLKKKLIEGKERARFFLFFFLFFLFFQQQKSLNLFLFVDFLNSIGLCIKKKK